MLLRLILALSIVLMPNLLYLKFGSAVPGLNPANLLLVLLIAALLVSRRSHAQPLGTGVMTAPLVFWVSSLLVGFAIATVTMPIDFVADLAHLKNLVFFPLLYFVYRRCGQDLRGTRQLIYLSMAVAVLAGADAVIDALSFDISQYSDTQRTAGPFGTANASNRAGVFYAMFLPLLLAVVLFSKGKPWWRLAALVGCVILSMAIMATFSRQAYLIALLAAGLLLLRRNVLLAVMLALLAVPAATLLPDAVSGRVAATQQFDAVGSVKFDSSTASRFEIWSGAWEMWKEQPAGVGLNRFQHRIGDYSEYEARDAHNIFVLMLAECGVLGLLAVLWLLWRLLKLALAVRHVAPGLDDESRTLGLGFSCAILAMALGNVYGTPFHDGLVMANFWALCGLIEHYVALRQHERVSGSSTAAGAPSSMNIGQLIGTRFPMATRALPGRYRAIPR